MFTWDEKISSRIDSWIDGYPGRIIFATVFAKYIVWVFFGAAMIVYRAFAGLQEGYPLYIVLLLVTVGVPHVFSVLLSLAIRRKRPYEHLPDAWHLPLRIYTPSFPSGHATIVFATLSFFIIYWQPPLIVALGLGCIAVLVALARVLVGVHYVSDILAGALIGSVGGWLAFTYAERILLFFWR